MTTAVPRPASDAVTSDEIFAGADLDENGTAVLRMPVGTYSGWLSVDVEGANGPGSLGTALLSFVDVDLSQDRSVVMDARKAVQVEAEVPQETDPAAMRLDVIRQFPSGGYTASSMFPAGEYDSLWALPTGKEVTDGLFEFGDAVPPGAAGAHDRGGSCRSRRPAGQARCHAALGGYPHPGGWRRSRACPTSRGTT